MRKVLPLLLFVSITSIIIISCKKESDSPYKSTEQTLIKLPEAETGPKTIALDLNPGVVTLPLIEIRRDASSEKELKKAQVVKVAKSTSVLADQIGGGIVELPRTVYEDDTDNPFDGQYWTVTFQPGEFVKFLKIKINPSNLITLGRVGLGFVVAEAAGCTISSAKSQLAVEISAKNQWDGRYALTFSNYHPASNPGYTGATTEVQLHTSGPNRVKIFWPLAGVYACPSVLNGNFSYFTFQEPEYTINTSTNAVTVQNVAAGATTFYNMATGYNSRYEPGTKTFYLKWGYGYAAGAFDPANTREWTQQLVYLGPR